MAASVVSELLPYLVATEAIVVILGGIYALGRRVRSRWGRKPDRLALLNHLLPPIRMPPSFTPGWLLVVLVVWLILYVLTFVFLTLGTVLSAMAITGLWASSGPGVDFVTGMDLLSQALFVSLILVTLRLRPLITHLLREDERRKAEARVQ